MSNKKKYRQLLSSQPRFRDNKQSFSLKSYIRNNKTLLALGMFFLILQCINLTKLPIFNDESIYLDWGWREIHIPGNLFYSLFDGKPPFLMWIFGISESLFADPLIAGRIVSVLFGLVSALGLLYLSKKYIGRKASYLAFFLYTGVPLFLLYNRQALMESAILAVGVWSCYLFFDLLNHPKIKHGIFLGLLLGFGYFMKSSAAAFLAPIIGISLWYLFWKEYQYKRMLLISLVVMALSSLCALFVLFLQPSFWSTFSMNDRYVLGITELIGFPLSIWFKNIVHLFEISFWQITPLVFIATIAGGWIVLKQKNIYVRLVLIWMVIETGVAILLSKDLTPRYIVSFLPFMCVMSASFFEWISERKKSFYYPGLIVVFFTVYLISAVQIISPQTYFGLLNKVTSLSQQDSYIGGWTSGYGIPEVVSYLDQQGKNTKIFATVRMDAGNPESAVFAYFNASGRVHPAYLDEKMFGGKLSTYSCIRSDIPLYFISRDVQLAGLNRYLVLLKKYSKPIGDSYIGVYTLKKNCSGKTLELSSPS